MRTTLAVLLALASSAHADRRADTKAALDEFRRYGFLGKPEPFEPRVSPTTARWISIATTTAGLGLSAYLWHHAGALPADNGRSEMQLTSIGTGLATIGLGPASGLLVAGEGRRAIVGSLGRPALVTAGALGAGVGAFVIAWGCFETNDCTGAKVGGGIMLGAGALMAAGGIAWSIYDIWDTPRILRRRMPRQAAIVPLVGGDRVGLALALVE